MCFGVKILNFVYFGVNKSGISVFLVSAENVSKADSDAKHKIYLVCGFEGQSHHEDCLINMLPCNCIPSL